LHSASGTSTSARWDPAAALVATEEFERIRARLVRQGWWN
jgi:hypothetical protein